MLIDSPIAVIDSGMGGLKFLKGLKNTYKSENLIYLADNAFMPYGNKSEDEIKRRLFFLTKFLIDNFNIKMLVLACNTASMVGLDYLRNEFNINIFGVNPKINQEETGIICTKLTAKKLSEKNVVGLPKLAEFVENNILCNEKIEKYLKRVGKKHKLDRYKSIVLGCTHYELIKPSFEKVFPQIKFLSPIQNSLDEIKSRFKPEEKERIGECFIFSSLASKSYTDKLNSILETL